MRRRAFTILELLAATALTAALLLAVFQVIGSLGRTQAAIARTADADGPWRADLLDALRRDLANASTARFDRDGGVTLAGHGSLDRATLAPGHDPVVVTYALATVGGRTWLVRRQSPRDGFPGPPAWSELLCPDVAAFAVVPAANSLVEAPRTGIEPASGGPVPAAVVVRLDGPGGRLIDEVVVIR